MKNYVSDHDKLVRLMGMTIESVTTESARVTMPLLEQHRNGMGMAHGGTIFSLADVAFGAAANAETSTAVVSLNTTIQYLRAGQSSPLVAVSHLIRGGSHIVTYDVEVFDGSGALIAKCLCTGYHTNFPLPG
ncbi:MAG: PaaI family thioesterase [Desulfovibrio sp.]|jgi:acyl-CoA thioesterase|nr:PaaI family thioesterase [Desulfovibrio sp.]